jgi:hypothetical protein
LPGIEVKKQRLPEMDQELYGRYMKIPKADWANVYFDLFRQIYGEYRSDEEVMQDVEMRLDMLKFSREK